VADRERETLAQVIARLADETNAPLSLVREVSGLFMAKGIGLDELGAPYEPALRQAFLCDAQLRIHSARARDGLARLGERLKQLDDLWTRQGAACRAAGAALAEGKRALEAARPLPSRLASCRVPGPGLTQ